MYVWAPPAFGRPRGRTSTVRNQVPATATLAVEWCGSPHRNLPKYLSRKREETEERNCSTETALLKGLCSSRPSYISTFAIRTRALLLPAAAAVVSGRRAQNHERSRQVDQSVELVERVDAPGGSLPVLGLLKCVAQPHATF